jgi:phytoene desaturase
MKRKVAIIGSGFSGIAAAAYVARQGYEVNVFEKHAGPGGRARQFITDNGYVFDMGPSWYWMPDIIESFFRDFKYKVQDFYELISLDPQFEIIFSDDKIQVPHKYDDLKKLFEEIEPGAGIQLDIFMQAAKFKYEAGMLDFVNKPCHSWMEFVSPKILKNAIKLDLLSNFRSYVARYFKSPKLRTLMEFPIIFLGASPRKIPALYSLMNYGGYAQGTYYPLGGFYQLVAAMQKVAEEQGAVFNFNHTVEKINTANNKITSLIINGLKHEFEAVIASSDYHHTEKLLNKNARNYTEAYWKERIFAPSCLIYYLGFNEKIKNLKHHTLFFENSLDEHINAIYGEKRWPENPLFYCCCPSKTDESVAFKNHENVFLLMPVSIAIEDDENIRQKYLLQMISRLEKHTGAENLMAKIDFQKSYCVSDFVNDYNAYGGNAYGLANTLSQTGFLKPKIRNNKIFNLFYTGQLTVPGPGVPSTVISGKIVANEMLNLFKTKN